MLSTENLFEEFTRSKKNANCILKLEKSLLSSNEEEILSSIETVQECFAYLFSKSVLSEELAAGSTEENFRLWLLQRYKDLLSHLNDYLTHENETIQERSLEVLMKALMFEGTKPIKELNADNSSFPKHLLEAILSGLLSKDLDQHSLIMKFHLYTEYDDIKLNLLKSILKFFLEVVEVTDVFLCNCFHLLNTIKYPSKFFSKENPPENSNTLIPQKNASDLFYLNKKSFGKVFSSVWIHFLRYNLPSYLTKKTLLILHKKVVSHLQNPCLLTDFLTNAYSQGGIVSLLSLNSLYYLMSMYNVEYPDFFLKLYSLTDREIMNGKFGSKFFYLCDLFLSSTYLPASVVAAFVKKMCRISLSSNTETILKIIPFICNLLIRHPTLSTLIHRAHPKEFLEDPYDFSASDPSRSRAEGSSLWELKTLQNHFHPEVVRKAKWIDREMTVVEYPLSLNASANELYERGRKRKFVAAPLNVEKAPKLDSWWILPRDARR